MVVCGLASKTAKISGLDFTGLDFKKTAHFVIRTLEQKKKIDISNVYLVRRSVKRIKNTRYSLDKKLFLKRNIKFSHNERASMERGDTKPSEGNFMATLLLF